MRRYLCTHKLFAVIYPDTGNAVAEVDLGDSKWLLRKTHISICQCAPSHLAVFGSAESLKCLPVFGWESDPTAAAVAAAEQLVEHHQPNYLCSF